MEIIETVIVDAPLKKTFNIFTDFNQMQERVSGIKGLRIISDNQPQPGFKWAETRRMGKNEGEAEFEITEFSENEKFTAEGSHGGMHFLTTQVFESNNNKTNITVTSITRPVSLGMKIVLALFGFAMKKEMRQTILSDIHDLKKVAESQ